MHVARVNAPLTPVPSNLSGVGPDLLAVCAQFSALLRVYVAVSRGLLRPRRESQGRERGRQYHAAKKYPFHLSCSSIKLRFKNGLPTGHHSAARKAFQRADRTHFGGEQITQGAQTPARHLKARRPCFGGPCAVMLDARPARLDEESLKGGNGFQFSEKDKLLLSEN
jgi:hypothetical protein